MTSHHPTRGSEALTGKLSSEENHANHKSKLEETGFWGQRAAGCLFLARDTGRLLIAHRSKDVEQPHTWGTWGGAIDHGETPEQAVLREVFEESGYEGLCIMVPLALFSHACGFNYHNFLAIIDAEFTPQLDHETQDFQWCELDQMPNPLHPGLVYLLEQSKTEIARLIALHAPVMAPHHNSPQRRP